jgi:hypothetical protein
MIQRVATVRATGDRYIVQRMTIGGNAAGSFVHCWGEVVGLKTGRGNTDAERLATGSRTTHQGSKTFVRDAVDIVEIDVTGHVARELFAQGIRNLKHTGRVLATRRR